METSNLYLTNKELYQACKQNKYLLVRGYSGWIKGINCKVADIILKNKNVIMSEHCGYVSYKSCSLMEYLNYKVPFL